MIIVKQEGYSAIVTILGTVSGESVSQWSELNLVSWLNKTLSADLSTIVGSSRTFESMIVTYLFIEIWWKNLVWQVFSYKKLTVQIWDESIDNN